MFRQVINHIPFSLLITLMMAMFVSISFLSSLFSNYFVSVEEDNEHTTLSNSLMSILTGGFFVLLAFIIINTWNYLQDASNSASKEADYLALIIRNSTVFPEVAQKEIKNAVREYTVAVRVTEWAAMRNGKESPEAWNALDKLYETIQRFQPKSKQEGFYYNSIINNLNGVLSSRRVRLNKIVSIIPPVLTYSIFWGSIFLAILLGIIRGTNKVLNMTPILLFSGLFGFNLALALSFDYPYSGDIAVSNKTFYSGVLAAFSDNNTSPPTAKP